MAEGRIVQPGHRRLPPVPNGPPPATRSCAEPECTTVLSSYNTGLYCSRHEGRHRRHAGFGLLRKRDTR